MFWHINSHTGAWNYLYRASYVTLEKVGDEAKEGAAEYVLNLFPVRPLRKSLPLMVTDRSDWLTKYVTCGIL
ncbi:hypothetical protein DOA20_26030 [Salmonella enterica subsp. enterica serovar Newport]|nr:hypothetical protein [Salmonella enterica subsp. enterica serovar Newport]